MLRIFPCWLMSFFAMVLPAAALAQEQPASAPAQAPASGAAGAPVGGPAPLIPGANDVVATVTNGNQTDKITKIEVIAFLSHYPPPSSADRESIYRDAIEHVGNTKLLTQFLSRQRIPIPPERIDEEIERLRQQLKSQGQDLTTLLEQGNQSMASVRKDYEERIRWSEWVKSRATDAALRKFVADNRDFFSGTQVRASHILLKVEPNASEAEKEKARKKLAEIKNDIDQHKLTFAEAANKYSQDPANAGGAGGDLDYFTLRSGYIEEFTSVAFKLRKGAISDPVETPFGYHLIELTDRREGKPIDFEQNKPLILQEFATDLQKNIVTAERKNAKFDIKPMPKDFFPPEAPAGPGGGEPEKAKTEPAATPKS